MSDLLIRAFFVLGRVLVIVAVIELVRWLA